MVDILRQGSIFTEIAHSTRELVVSVLFLRHFMILSINDVIESTFARLRRILSIDLVDDIKSESNLKAQVDANDPPRLNRPAKRNGKQLCQQTVG